MDELTSNVLTASRSSSSLTNVSSNLIPNKMRYFDVVEAKSRLLELIKKSLSKEPVVLSSGRKSTFYIDGKKITLSSEGANLTAKIVLDYLYSGVEGTESLGIDSIGGLTMGADPIVGAVAAISFEMGRPIDAFIVRKEPKKHGLMKQIEGPLKENSRVAIIDDITTTGDSLLKAIDAVESLKCKVVKVITIVDRLEGAKEAIGKRGYRLESIFTKHDLGIDNKKGFAQVCLNLFKFKRTESS